MTARVINYEEDADTHRSSQIVKSNTLFLFESFGENVHYLYDTNDHFDRKNVILHALDERNCLGKVNSRVYENNEVLFTMEHPQNNLEAFCYPFFTNGLTLNRKGRLIGEVRQNCCRACQPLYCLGQVNACARRTFTVQDKTHHPVLIVEGNFECIFEICREFVVYNLYVPEDRELVGTVREVNQFCRALPCPCSCQKMFSWLGKRTFRVEVREEFLRRENHREYLFAGLAFLSKVTHALIY